MQKFGGTSVGSIDRIYQVAEHIIKAKNDGNQVVVVVSAMSGETNRLMDLAQQIDSVPTARELDVLLSAGEQVSMALLAMTLNKLGYASRSLTGAQANIVTDNQHNGATIKHIDTEVIFEILKKNQIVILAGFQGVNENGDITTLGRGGSDTSAVTVAGALKADECQIFTDVDGIYTCDPRIVKKAQKLSIIDFPTMAAMASGGAKVLHLPSVLFAWQNQVPLRVLSTFDENEGSLVKGEIGTKAISGIAIQRELAIIEVDNENLSSIKTQCQMLSIDIWNVFEETERTGIVIMQEACAKLELVFCDAIRKSEIVSLLTVVGERANGMVEHACQLLAQHNIVVNFSATNTLAMMLGLSPENVEAAANILHDAYVISSESLQIQQKHAFLG